MGWDPKVYAKLSEFQIESLILSWLNVQPGIFAVKVDTSGYWDQNAGHFKRRKSPYVLRGTSDIIGVYYSRYFAIEVKSSKGKPSDEQLLFLMKVKDKGGLCGIARTLEDAKRILEGEYLEVEAPKKATASRAAKPKPAVAPK